VRQFLAAELPGAVRRELEGWCGTLARELAGWRFLDPASAHLTLRFLGEVGAERDRAARPVWRQVVACGRTVRLRLAAPGAFPPRGRPRVLWAGIEEVEPGTALAALAHELEQAARELGFPAELRPFHPHVTVARARREGDAARAAHALEPTVEGWIREVVLFASQLGPAGARYTALESFPLRGPDRGEEAGRA